MKKVLAIALFFAFGFLCFSLVALAAERVEINTASLEQLDTIVGIGPAYAQRIIDARPFSSVDDLIRVSGIGEKTLQKIKEQGLAYVEGGTIAVEPMEAINEPIKEAPMETHSPRVYYDGVVINEVLPSPEGPDEENEWIELYNQNNFEVNLSDWKIEDAEGTKTTYIFGKNAKITAKEFLVLKRPETKITLNNSGDGLNLIWPDNKVIDSLSYAKAPSNQSYGRIASDWQWSANLTPGKANKVAQPAPNSLPKEQIYDNNIVEAGLTASVSDAINPNRNSVSNRTSPWLLFFTAIIITIISAVLVLFIKIKLTSNT